MLNVPAALRKRYPHLQFGRRWTVSPDVHYQLGQCNTTIRAIGETPLSPDRRSELGSVSLIKGAQATTAIEGNTLTDDEVRQVAEGESLPPSKEYQEREVRNVIDAMNGILEDVVGRESAPSVSPALVRSFSSRSLGERLSTSGSLRNATGRGASSSADES